MTKDRSQNCVKTGQSKLRRLLSSTLLDNRCRCTSALFALLVGHASSVGAQPKETLIWLVRDLPPMTIFEGPKKGQGVIDHLMPFLIAGMPQYNHTVIRVNRARGIQMLHETTFTCDPALIRTQEREQWIAFSTPAFLAVTNGLVIRQSNRSALAPYLVDGEVDLPALMNSGKQKIGVIAERSYGPYFDALLEKAPTGALTAHYGNDALGSLLQMQRLGRLQMVLGYWPEIRYQASHENIGNDELAFYPVKGTGKYLPGYIGCSATPQGKQAIIEINKLLGTLPHDRLNQAYADWLDPERRSDYLEEAKVFFEKPAAQ
ncbi:MULTISPECIES: TIGR02285 family protein [unclassified Pseudomonas]|uniref:TIGR02285 family protein n=1 Tax=unclassified Pseudomonas TaxID=196821 RepID=UPI002AC8A8E0|nr:MULTISPECIES: TIGR02285 family protein [unclassified Pseudomonas]MEB0047398.1 TIGR02285 family protein [Pseudomonas sp. Dout3]MEB0094639.1 TIGR02285 family protein [Pseudomonas sp. DC1.2]WPX61555.1 TIGR02285 family protein [Pseudomonas sp. DC1.2]